MTSEAYKVEGKRLGRKRPLVGVPVLDIGDIIPHINQPPPSADHFERVAAWGMYGNDRYEDCGPAAVGNMRRLVTSYLADAEEVPTLSDVLNVYRLCNPGFTPQTDANDNGVVLQQMMGKLLHQGIGPKGMVRRPLAFGRLDISNPNALYWGIALFGCVLLGVDLTQAQETQGKTWDYAPGSPPWGGHAVLACAYDSATGKIGAESWAARYEMTRAFLSNQLEEAWVIAWPEHLEHAGFLQNVDVAALRSRFRSLTGREMGKDPAVITPPAQPAAPGQLAVPSHGVPCGENAAAASLIAASIAWLGQPHAAAIDTATQARQITGLANSFLPWFRAVAGPPEQGNALAGLLAHLGREVGTVVSQNDEVLAGIQTLEDAFAAQETSLGTIGTLIGDLQAGQALPQSTIDALSKAVADAQAVTTHAQTLAATPDPAQPAAPPADGS